MTDNLSQTSTDAGAANSWPAALLSALQRLDQLLESAAQNLESSLRSGPQTSFRGLYVASEDFSRALSQSPGSTPFVLDRSPLAESDSGIAPALAPLMRGFGISPFDIDLVLLALAPELDLRYERIFAYLQDDVTRKRPTVELALNLLCSSAQEKLERRAHFSPQAPLVSEGLLHMVPDPNQVEPPLLAHYLKLDEQVTRMLLGDSSLDPRLAPCCTLQRPSDGGDFVGSTEIEPALAILIGQAHSAGRPLKLYFQGPRGSGKLRLAQALAASVQANLLVVRADHLLELPGARDLLPLLLREAQLREVLIYIAVPEEVPERQPSSLREDLLDVASRYHGITIFAGRKKWVPAAGTSLAVQPVLVDVLDVAGSRACWGAELASHGLELDKVSLEMIASRFRLTAGQIKSAVAGAVLNSDWRSARHSADSTAGSGSLVEDVCAAARAQCGHELGRLANKIEPRYGWDDIVLPADQVHHLREICVQAEYRNAVYGDWGFDRKLSLGKGLNVLFTGPPGVGKTMGAEVIARELRLDLYRIDLSQVVSKYIGESEKNLDKIFTAAENSNAILFFDEADALFGKRSEVRDSHDRYANIEISYLLQKMEEYQGISILATNLRQNLDDAFMRRLQAVVEFPFPDEEYRARIWKSIFPKETPLAPDVDFNLLAREIPLAGGNIKNMALVAAFYAAGDGGAVSMEHLIQAAYREHQKIGRTWDQSGLLKPQTVS